MVIQRQKDAASSISRIKLRCAHSIPSIEGCAASKRHFSALKLLSESQDWRKVKIWQILRVAAGGTDGVFGAPSTSSAREFSRKNFRKISEKKISRANFETKIFEKSRKSRKNFRSKGGPLLFEFFEAKSAFIEGLRG